MMENDITKDYRYNILSYANCLYQIKHYSGLSNKIAFKKQTIEKFSKSAKELESKLIEWVYQDIKNNPLLAIDELNKIKQGKDLCCNLYEQFNSMNNINILNSVLNKKANSNKLKM